MNQTQITRQHLSRQAIIYIRQSTLRQVRYHQESQKRQYELQERAQALGWPAAHCVVIDDDLGISGAQSHNRPGYQKLISQIALRQVGIVLGLEVSRLARNSLDWYQLLELTAAFNVLIADEEGVYDASEFNDRLLLGLKGTISEVELYQIKARLQRGRLYKAQRGELPLRTPIGLVWDKEIKKPRLSTDASIRHAIEILFDLFRRIRSVRGVLVYCARHHIRTPHQGHQYNAKSVEWRQPNYGDLHRLFKNPAYAGVYCYGKVKKQYDPLTQKTKAYRLPQAEWQVFIPHHFPGYITLAEFEENQRLIAHNRFQFPESSGAARSGTALLQGIVFCQNCGLRMHVSYCRGEGYYVCDRTRHFLGKPVCNCASSKRVDAQIVELLLAVVNAGSLELASAADAHYQQQLAEQEKLWQDKLQRFRYQVDLTRRRYEAVDPSNRLVAQTLETEWNQALVRLTEAEQQHRRQKQDAVTLRYTQAQLQSVLTNFQQHWYASDIPLNEQKEILRCLIDQVSLKNGDKMIEATVTWQGGTVTQISVLKYLYTPPGLYWRIADLAQSHTDRSIAQMLNEADIKTARGRIWTERHVMDFRMTNRIPSGFTTAPDLRLSGNGFITTAEAAQALSVHISTIQRWFKRGVLDGKQDKPRTPLWIAWDEDIAYRLTGNATPDPQMVSVYMLARTRQESLEDVLCWAKRKGHHIYRLRRGMSLRFYILPKDAASVRS
jgi:DNA invertase Pin-like site-specific DNA recombinase